MSISQKGETERLALEGCERKQAYRANTLSIREIMPSVLHGTMPTNIHFSLTHHIKGLVAFALADVSKRLKRRLNQRCVEMNV